MNLSAFITKATTEVQQIALVIFILIFTQGLAKSEYIVKVASQSTLVNPGENYMAYCNIPGQGALDIISNLMVKWFHNGQALTSLCEFLSTELAQRYSCKVLSPQQNNISLELTISNVQRADAGNLTCEVYEKIKEGDNWVRDELVARNSVPIQVRGDPKFRCTNTSAIVNNKRHIITCEVYDVDGIYCNKIRWKREDTGEDYRPGRYININVACRAITNSKIETTLEILQVTAEYFKTLFSVIYDDPLFQTKEYQISIPEA